ncbi:hypothetical protein C8R43DRAFT_1044313 [Mycena crocata]|nr:hypothetical protein C8R43DRAFT_1044313 [Mycena crocata]
MPATPIEGLSEYLFLLICLELEVKDIISLRRVCRVFGAATHNKLLWINLLDISRSEGHVLPLYLKTPHLLDAATLEALVLRVARVARQWKLNDICPVKAWRIHLPQSITWLRLVSGSCLFVASSDNEVSKISCWDLSLMFQGYMNPIAEAYLPGQVKTSQLEVQDEGIVLALGLGPNSPSVHVITLRQHLGSHYFAELRRIEGSSHILMLHGNFVGCALRHDTIVPHIINWGDDKLHILSPPGGPDIPDRRSAPHLFVIWNDFIVVVRQNALELYTQPSSTKDPVYLKSIATFSIWEVVVLDPLSCPSSSLRLLTISLSGIELCTLEADTVFDSNVVFTHTLLANSPSKRVSQMPWYHLAVNGTGKRALWLAIGDSNTAKSTYPHVVSLRIAPSDVQSPLIFWTNNFPQDPALWAFPVLDFDEALGLTVIGNCFGELAIYDHVASDPNDCCGLAVDSTDQQSPLPLLLPLDAIPLGLRLTPRPVFGHTEPDEAIVSDWSQDDLGVDVSVWRTDWLSGTCWDWDQLQGNLGDTAWLLDHAYGFPAIVPQAYATEPYTGDVEIIIRSGRRYLVYTKDATSSVRSCQSGPLPPHFRPSHAEGDPQSCLRPTAYTVRDVHLGMFVEEFHSQAGRNRWAEQQERGGRPHKNLLDTSPVVPLGR